MWELLGRIHKSKCSVEKERLLMRPFFSSLREPPRALASLLCLLILQCCHVSLHYAWSHPFNRGNVSARLSSAQLVCSSRSPPPQHFPTVPLLSRCRTYGGVLKGDRQRSPDTPHLVPTNTSAPAEKNTCARFSLEPITPVFFFVVFFALPPFLPPSRCVDGSSCSCHCSYSPGPGGPYRVNCINAHHHLRLC